MSTIHLTPYIFFTGNCREAMDFYQSVFGGEVTYQTYGDVHMASEVMTEDKIMHAVLEGGVIKLFGSDTAKASAVAAKVTLNIDGVPEDDAQMRQMFDALSNGGDVFQQLKKEFWGDTFGAFKDKFGIEWSFNIPGAKEA